MSTRLIPALDRVNASRDRLVAQIDKLPSEARASLEHALRVGAVSTEDVQAAKQILRSSKTALDHFFTADDRKLRPLLLEVLHVDTRAQLDFTKPNEIRDRFNAVARAWDALRDAPRSVDKTIREIEGQGFSVDAKDIAVLRSGDSTKIRAVATERAERARVFAAAFDLAMALKDADFLANMRLARDPAFWAMNAVLWTTLLGPYLTLVFR